MSDTQAAWQLKTPTPEAALNREELLRMGERLEVSSLLVHLMTLRGLTCESDMDKFLSPGLRYLHSLDKWPGVEDGAVLMCSAIKANRRIAVWGDYDVDGITATALVKDFLASRNVDVIHYIPDRLDFGYGLHVEGIRSLAEQGVGLLLTVDCGIANTEEIREAKRLGLQVIITDHHLPGQELPEADVIINPK
ncbi:MAG: DHH family phosphoesterase, partial [Desulfomicrobium sp.]|nr:DHH family phosphoesterase [Desulfomicrobium sp.]